VIKIFLYTLSFFFIHLNISANSFSIFGGSYDYDDDFTSTLYGFNYHMTDSQIDVFDLFNINPVIGGFVTAKSAGMFYSGFETNIGQDKIFLNLSSSAGIYSNGNGKDLGNALQFKSEVNLFYRLNNSTRIGFGSHHISNAGLSSVNPGTNNYYLIFNKDF
jgi:lipid A 3-O-deacylase